jgi:LPXTG-motif cell wall-anchored protein
VQDLTQTFADGRYLLSGTTDLTDAHGDHLRSRVSGVVESERLHLDSEITGTGALQGATGKSVASGPVTIAQTFDLSVWNVAASGAVSGYVIVCNGNTLPETGSSTTRWAWTGLGFVAAGAALVQARRSRRARSSA